MSDVTVVQQALKVQAPEVFTGDRSKLHAFLRQLRTCFTLRAGEFTKESMRVLYAINCMRGPPADWFGVALEDYLEEDGDLERMETQNAELFRTFNQFETKIKEIFGDPDEERTLARTIGSLRQAGTIQNYTASMLFAPLNQGGPLFDCRRSHISSSEAAPSRAPDSSRPPNA